MDVDLKLRLIIHSVYIYIYIAACAIYLLWWVNEVGNQFDRSVKVNDCRACLMLVDPADDLIASIISLQSCALTSVAGRYHDITRYINRRNNRM